MSFDIFFEPFRLATTRVELRNPFTKKTESLLPHELSAEEVDAVRAVLAKYHAPVPDQSGCFLVELEAGRTVEVFCTRIEHGCMVAVRGFTPRLLDFLMDLLRAGTWAMTPAMKDEVAIMASPQIMEQIPGDFPVMKRVVCSSNSELAVLLKDGYQTWQDFRDYVAGS